MVSLGDRQAILNAYEVELRFAVARGEMSDFNAECNFEDIKHWPTVRLVEWCEQIGLKPLYRKPPDYTVPYPRPKRTGHSVSASSDYCQPRGGDPNCEHRWYITNWSGIECNDCWAT